MMPEDNRLLNVGLVGLGKMGISHCAIVNAHPRARVAAVCDTSGLTLDALRKYTEIVCYSDYQKLFKHDGLDAVLVATPTRFHASMVDEALERGMHVFCEKPFVLNTHDGEKLARKAVVNNLVNQVGYHYRFVATFNKLADLVKSGALGDIHHFLAEAYGPVILRPKGSTWRANKSEGGGCLPDYASHVINLVQFILGNTSGARGTVLKRLYSKSVEDAVYSTLFLDSGVSGQLSVNWSDETYRKMSVRLTVTGTEGKIVSDAQELKLYLKNERTDLGFDRGWNTRYITDYAKTAWYNLRGEEYSGQIDYFVSRVLNGQTAGNINSFAEALKTDECMCQLRADAGEDA